ncbi:MAG: hypothetical protein P1U36_10340 [Legionellaceae bacterium]|nr:hypothetical protein [Legionellaceae bacterium]
METQISKSEAILRSEIVSIPKGETGATGAAGATGVTGATGPTYTGGTGIIVDSDTNTISQTPTYTIGDTLEGGTIFYLDATNRHGLMVLTTSLTPEVTALFNASGSTSADGTAISPGIGGGQVNSQYWYSYFQSQDFMTSFSTSAVGYSLSQAPTEAGGSCPLDGVTLCYSGWYLPSISELQILHSQSSTIIPACTSGTGTAWSSSSSGTSTDVYTLQLVTGATSLTSINSATPLCVLPVRQF